MQFAYLAAAGYSGALADKMAAAAGGDFTAPVLSGNSFNDTTDAATFRTTEGGTFVWATHLTTETLTANGSGGWTGSLLESGTDTVASSGESTISAAYTATTGTGGESRKFSYYIRDAAGNDSNVITETFTVNSTGPSTVAFDSSTWVNLTLDGLSASPSNLVIAGRFKRTAADGAGDTYFLSSGNATGDSYLDSRDSGDDIGLKAESGSGGVIMSYGGAPSMASGAAVSFFIRIKSGASELVTDGTTRYTNTVAGYPSIKNIARYLNSSDGANPSLGFQLVGGLWVSEASGGYDALTYSDFFDGSNDPIFNSATINGIAASFFENGNAAAWNALSGITGTVTDV